MPSGNVLRPTPEDIAQGYLFGSRGEAPSPDLDAPKEPRPALEAAIRTALGRPPCVVAFSGGRDSSAVLAVAIHVARREGLPAPVPVSWTFPDIPTTNESEWQELVVRHLDITDWVRLRLADELDHIGPLAAPLLKEHGVLFPPTLHGDMPLLEQASGGTLIDGEGGDEVLGHDPHRIAPLAAVLGKQAPLTLRSLRRAAGAVAPRTIRRNRARRRLKGGIQPVWLTPRARQAMLDELLRVELDAPLSWRKSLLLVPTRRTQTTLRINRGALAAPHDVRVISPLLDGAFIHALARRHGPIGFPSRTVAMHMLVGDLLPEPILSRESKTHFTDAFVHKHTRRFVADWTGDGLGTEVERLVDVAALRRLWQERGVIAPTAMLLQHVWLATHGRVGH